MDGNDSLERKEQREFALVKGKRMSWSEELGLRRVKSSSASVYTLWLQSLNIVHDFHNYSYAIVIAIKNFSIC